MEIIINGKVTADPRTRVLAIEAAAQALCEAVGEDPAEATMMLLTAAVHITMKSSDKPINEITLLLAECLGNAIIAADGFFTLRQLAEGNINER
jgi:hypothetical protein